MRAPFSFLLPAGLAGLTLLVPCFALAQNAATEAVADAANPAAPTAPMPYRGMADQSLVTPDGAVLDWRAAHAAVGAFPRGHADIVAWEAAQSAAMTPSRTPLPDSERQP